MPYFATRTEIGPVTEPDAVRFAAEVAGIQPGLLGAYWTPARGQVFAVHEAAAPPGTGPDYPGEAFPVLPITAEEYGPPALEPAAGAGEGLQLVLVRRQLSPLTEAQFRAVALQAIMCAHEYDDMLWLRSYWDVEQNQLNCLFRTRTHDLVREHAARSRIPCDEINDAVEIFHTKDAKGAKLL